MHRSPSGLALLVAALVSAAAPALAQERDSSGEQAMLDAINARRAAASLPPLSRAPELDAAAVRHSEEMAAADVLEHVNEQSGTPADRVHTAGLAIDEIAENVAMHYTTANAQQSLEDSEAHLANMLNPRFTHIGIASVVDPLRDSYTTVQYVTQVFGRIEAAAPAASEPPAAVEPEAPPPAIAAPSPDAPQVVEVIPPDVAPPPASATVQAAPGYATEVAPGARATVIVPGPGGGVAGYWVCAQSRWWYFPLPPGAQPGQQLSPDLRVSGGPPGYPATGCVAGQTVQPAQSPMYAPPPVYTPPPPPRVYYPPPPPRVYYPPPPPRRVIVMPAPGTVIAPYAPVYPGPGVRIDIGPRRGVRIEGRWGRRYR